MRRSPAVVIASLGAGAVLAPRFFAAALPQLPAPSAPLVVIDDGVRFPAPRTGATLGDTLRAADVQWSAADLLLPSADTPTTSIDTVLLERARTVTVRVGTETRHVQVRATHVGEVLLHAEISLGPTDRVVPAREMPVADGATIVVTRVHEGTDTEVEKIAPPLRVLRDPTLPLDTEIVVDAGRAGQAERVVRTRTENGHVVARRTLQRTVVEKPQARVVRRGTKVTVLGSETGRASWFDAAPKTAAHRTLQFGTKLRVTRTDTHASVLVRVHDRGPFIPGRVVDLSRDAFRALAPLSAGTIPVNVEWLE